MTRSDPADARDEQIVPNDVLETIREVAEQAAAEYGYESTVDEALNRVGRQIGQLAVLHETAVDVIEAKPGAEVEFERVLDYVLPAIEPPAPTGFRSGIVTLRGTLTAKQEERSVEPDVLFEDVTDSGTVDREEVDMETRLRPETSEFVRGVGARSDRVSGRTFGPTGGGISRGEGRDDDLGRGRFGDDPRGIDLPEGECTIDVDGFTTVMDAVGRTVDGDGVSDPSSQYWQYMERVSAVMNAVEPAVMLYERAKGVHDGDRSLRSFGNALLAVADGSADRREHGSGRKRGSASFLGGRSGSRGRSKGIVARGLDEQLNESADVGELLDTWLGDVRTTSLTPPDGGRDPAGGPVGPVGPDDPPTGVDPKHCPTRRNQRKWRRAACQRAINEGDDAYRIDHIENTTHGVTGRGCTGDSIVIHGREFGDDQRTGYVSFPGSGTAKVDSWSDTKIETTVPSGASSGDLDISVQPDYEECEGVGGRLPEADDSSPLFVVVQEPTIHEVTIGGETVSGGSATVEACTDVLVEVDATAADIIIRDTTGMQVFYSGGPYHRRTVSRKFESDEDETYTVEAESLCGSTSTTVTVNRERRLSLSMTDPLTPGDQLELTTEISCPAPAEGRTVTLTVVEGDVSIPNNVTITHGNTLRRVTQTVSGSCGPVRIEAETDDGRTASASTTYYEPATVDSLSLNRATGCQQFSVTATGSCFPTDPSKFELRFDLQGSSSTYIPRDDHVRVSQDGTKIDADVGDLPPGTYEVSVRITFDSVDLRGRESAQMTVTGSSPQINSFDNTNDAVACQNATSTLTWDVSGVSEVEVTDEDGATVATRQYQVDCQSYTDSVTVTVNKPPRRYTLKAEGAGSDPQTTTASATVRLIPTAATTYGASELQIANPSGTGTDYDIYYQDASGLNFVGTIAEGDTMTVDDTDGLQDCTSYRFLAFEPNRNPYPGNQDSEVPNYVQRDDLGPTSWILPPSALSTDDDDDGDDNDDDDNDE